MIYTDNLCDVVTSRHNTNNANEILILGGFIGPGPAENLAKNLSSSIDCKVIYGCYQKSNVNSIYHNKYQEITKNTDVKIYYKNNYNHSKIYVWKKESKIIDALIGSANFSTSGLNNDGSEILVKPRDDEFYNIQKYVDDALLDSQLCTTYSKSVKTLTPITTYTSSKENLDKVLSNSPQTIRIFLGDKVNHIHEKSGLNWGFGRGNVNISDAYIALRKGLIEEIPDFFPFNGVNPNIGTGQSKKNSRQNADAVFDDGTSMKLSFEGIGSKGYFKQISSFPQKKILGLYIRERLGISANTKISHDILKNYGRDNIDVTKTGDGLYSFDFGVPKK